MSKNWFVTGSSRGLGREIVVAALESGAKVFATCRNPAALDDLARNFGENLVPFALDVDDQAAVQVAVEHAKTVLGTLDVVVNNAGYANIGAVEDVTIEDFTRQIQTNFFGVVYISKAAVPIMREQGHGHIFQIASIGARVAGAGLSAYVAAKFAVRAFSLGLAQEVAPLGIRVVTLQPGSIATDWAGSSMVVPPISQPYQEMIGGVAAYMRDISGRNSSDADKIAKLVVDLADRQDVPAELLLGADAVITSQNFYDGMIASDRAWHPVSVSTGGSS